MDPSSENKTRFGQHHLWVKEHGLRWIGFLLSAAIACSFFLPWIDNPQQGSLSLFDIVRIIDAKTVLTTLQDLWDLTEVRPQDPYYLFPTATTAFVISFPLAALFAVIALLGYFRKWMGILLGGIPIGMIAYLIKAFSNAAPTVAGGTAPVSAGGSSNLLDSALGFFGIAVPTYLIAGVLLFLVSIFAPSRR